MKKFLVITGMLFLANSAKTQVLISILLGDKLNTGKIEFGLEGGWNWSNMTNLDPSKSLSTFNLGFYFDIKTKHPSWMLNTGVIVKSSMGADGLDVYSLRNNDLDSAFSGGEVARKISYFNVPIMMKYTFPNHIFLKAGTQLGLRYNAYDEFRNTVVETDDLGYKLKTKKEYHPLDAGLAIGAGYRLMKGNGMNFGLQYYYGLIDVVIDDSSPSHANRVLYLTAGIPIGKGSKKKAVEQPQN